MGRGGAVAAQELQFGEVSDTPHVTVFISKLRKLG